MYFVTAWVEPIDIKRALIRQVLALALGTGHF
jgi:hypothetical protein